MRRNLFMLAVQAIHWLLLTLILKCVGLDTESLPIELSQMQYKTDRKVNACTMFVVLGQSIHTDFGSSTPKAKRLWMEWLNQRLAAAAWMKQFVDKSIGSMLIAVCAILLALLAFFDITAPPLMMQLELGCRSTGNVTVSNIHISLADLTKTATATKNWYENLQIVIRANIRAELPGVRISVESLMLNLDFNGLSLLRNLYTTPYCDTLISAESLRGRPKSQERDKLGSPDYRRRDIAAALLRAVTFHIKHLDIAVDPTEFPASLYLLSKDIYSRARDVTAAVDVEKVQLPGEIVPVLVVLENAQLNVRNAVRGHSHEMVIYGAQYQRSAAPAAAAATACVPALQDQDGVQRSVPYQQQLQARAEHMVAVAEVSLYTHRHNKARVFDATFSRATDDGEYQDGSSYPHRQPQGTGTQGTGRVSGERVAYASGIQGVMRTHPVSSPGLRCTYNAALRLQRLVLPPPVHCEAGFVASADVSILAEQGEERESGVPWAKLGELFLYRQLVPLLTA